MPEPNHMGGYPENLGFRFSSSRLETWQGLQDLSRFVYNWKISFSGKSGVTVDRQDRSGNESRDNGRQRGFAKDRFVKSKESEVKKNFKDTRFKFKVGGGQ